MVNSLKLAHKDAQSIGKSQYHYYEIHTYTLGTMDQCSLSLDHMCRIIKTKSSTCLSKHNKNRRVPRGLKSADLSTLTVWLLAQCGSIETQARKVCRKLLIQLAPPSSREYTRISGSILTSDIARVYTIHEYLHEKQVLKYIQVYTRTKISRGDDFHVFILTIIN